LFQPIYNYPDLLASNPQFYERLSNGRLTSFFSGANPPSYWSGNPPSFFSGNTIPSYQTIDRTYINSCLENNINLDYFFLFILLIVILLNRKIIMKFFIKNSLIIIKYFIKILWIILILWLMFTWDRLIATAFMFPLSISSISYINDLDIPAITDFESERIEIFNKFIIKETSDFLNKLEDNESYIVEIGFIPNITLWDLDAPQMLLSKPLLINRNSSATTINKFILERLDYMVDYYYLDDTIIQKESNCAVSLTYCKLKSI